MLKEKGKTIHWTRRPEDLLTSVRACIVMATALTAREHPVIDLSPEVISDSSQNPDNAFSLTFVCF